MTMDRVFRPMPIGSQECGACAGTGEPSPWEYDHHIWLRGEPIAVCGACRGAGMVGRFGFRLSPAKVLAKYRAMNAILFGSDSDGSGEAGETRSGSTEGDSAGRNGIVQGPSA